MGAISVHEFISLDGVIDAPTWTFDYGFDPKMGEAIGAVTAALPGHPARAHDLRDVRAGVVDADRRGRSRGAVLQRHDQVRRLRDAHHCDVEELEDRRPVRRRRHPQPEGRGRRRPLRQRQRHAGAGDARRRPGGRAASVRLSAHPRVRSAALPRGCAAPRNCHLRPASRTRTAWSTWRTDRRRKGLESVSQEVTSGIVSLSRS